MNKIHFRKYTERILAILFILFLTSVTGYSANLQRAEKPTEIANGQPLFKKNKTIRILAIGNSFSQDAVEQYLYELADAEGIFVVIGNCYIGGCSLATHLKNATKDSPVYDYRKIENSTKTNRPKTSLAEAIADEKWDYISLQQVSSNSGQYETFKKSLPGLVDYVKTHATNRKMKIMLHQTWAYAKNSTHKAFPNYNNDQDEMYKSLVDAIDRAADLVDIDIIIPSGTAIQNGRTSCIGDHFNRDGYHLETTYGRYTVACTWFEKIFKKNVTRNSYAPAGVDSYKIEIAQHAAHAAVKNPDEVTDLKKYEAESVEEGMLE
ncbi:DUF4886 domain-containing protein [uncultured Draconibacterium sp.]|uniref:DUF4886 domain-containing protein n=1 Tax=uncultured Draconibacterium sp. TaxID=1573823 RepID=UPI0025ED6DB5|nr:DUF4886 domain-containing protein [uncultured Draconibacterium sp.]